MTENARSMELELIATIRGFLLARRAWELRTMERVTGWRRLHVTGRE